MSVFEVTFLGPTYAVITVIEEIFKIIRDVAFQTNKRITVK